MQNLLLLLLLLSLLSYVSGQGYNCTGVQTINPPANINNSYVYPATWDETTNPPQYASGQSCTWKIMVPKGMFAYFAMKAVTNKGAVLQMTDSTGYVTTFDIASFEPFFLMDPSFTVTLVSTNVGSMGLYVKWYNVKPVTTTSFVQVSANGSPQVLSIGDFDAGTTIQADSRVSLLSIPPPAQITDLTPYMRITQVFDGPTINSTLLGNLFQVMNSGRNLVSSGKYLTLYSLFSGFNIGSVAVAQDYFDVKQFNSYKAVWCLLPNLCDLSLDARNGTAAALRYSPSPFYVKTISLPLNSKVSVYTDSPNDAHRLATYTLGNIQSDVPQKFRSTFTTFALDLGQTVISLSSNTIDARWGIPFEGRSGFFASPYFPMYSAMQNFTDQIAGSQTFNISYTVKKADLDNGAQLQVTIFDGQTTPIDNVYSSSNLPQGTVWSRGDNLLVKYIPGTAIRTGAYVDFHFGPYKSANALNFLGAMIVTLWAALSL